MQKCYFKEGFGGKHLLESPLFSFFFQYVNGNKYCAFICFRDWYIDQFSKYRYYEKKDGGMYKGSLYQLIEKKHIETFQSKYDPDKFDDTIIRMCIEQRVHERFELADNIIKKGYHYSTSQPIIAKKVGENFILQDGHHRCSILGVLGYKVIPCIFISRF